MLIDHQSFTGIFMNEILKIMIEWKFDKSQIVKIS